MDFHQQDMAVQEQHKSIHRAEIVYRGGWIVRQIVGRPKARLFGFLSIIWLLVSVAASFGLRAQWPPSFSGLNLLCAVLLAFQLVFIVLAVVFWLVEQPRTIIEQHPNPDYDPRNLY
jgi:hypothetical protein